MERVAEAKFGAETKGWTIQRLTQPGIHPIISLQMLTPLHTLARFCLKDPDIAVSCETMPVPGKHRSGCSQSAIGCVGSRPHIRRCKMALTSCVLSGKQIICACAKGSSPPHVLCLPRADNSADGLQPIRE